jgi:hypothetical protein
MLKQHTIPLEESNIAGIGGADDRELRERAARSEANYAGAGDNVGVEGEPTDSHKDPCSIFLD